MIDFVKMLPHNYDVSLINQESPCQYQILLREAKYNDQNQCDQRTK